MRRLHATSVFAPIFAALALASCGQGPVLDIHDPVVRLNPVTQNPSALYFTIHGGPQATTLEDVFSPSTLRVAMHESVRDPATGVVRMKPLLRVPIPADTDVEFRPGGKHVMLYGINLPARRLDEIDLQFVFGNGDRLAATARIERVGDGEKEDMSGMDMGQAGGDPANVGQAPPAPAPSGS